MHNLQCPYSKANMLQNNFKQECIPVGLVQPVPVGVGCLPGCVCPRVVFAWGVSAWVGGCLPGWRDVCLGGGICLLLRTVKIIVSGTRSNTCRDVRYIRVLVVNKLAVAELMWYDIC